MTAAPRPRSPRAGAHPRQSIPTSGAGSALWAGSTASETGAAGERTPTPLDHPALDPPPGVPAVPRPSGVCPTPGCPNLQPCDEHKRQPWAGSTRRQRLPRGWTAKRRRILRRDRNVCYRCGRWAIEVDHVQTGDDHRDDNLAAICTDCHRRKSSAEGLAARRGRGATP